MFGNNPYAAVGVEMLAEANRIISDKLEEANLSESASQPAARDGLRRSLADLWQRRPHLKPQPALIPNGAGNKPG
jgi:hypothetical protein